MEGQMVDLVAQHDHMKGGAICVNGTIYKIAANGLCRVSVEAAAKMLQNRAGWAPLRAGAQLMERSRLSGEEQRAQDAAKAAQKALEAAKTAAQEQASRPKAEPSTEAPAKPTQDLAALEISELRKVAEARGVRWYPRTSKETLLAQLGAQE